MILTLFPPFLQCSLTLGAVAIELLFPLAGKGDFSHCGNAKNYGFLSEG